MATARITATPAAAGTAPMLIRNIYIGSASRMLTFGLFKENVVDCLLVALNVDLGISLGACS
jgi:hypothetical protein